MATTQVPGIQAKHTIITPTCRANRSIHGALDEAVRLLREEYGQLALLPANALAKFHLVLTVERPES